MDGIFVVSSESDRFPAQHCSTHIVFTVLPRHTAVILMENMSM